MTRARSVGPRNELAVDPALASWVSMVNFTSSAVSGSPLWNFTPRLRWKRHVVGVGFSQRVASMGLRVRLSPVKSTSASKMWICT